MQNFDKKALKSGIWYTLCNFLTKGLVFLTTPIFTRIMSVSDYGKYSAFITWQTLLLCILPLGFYTTVTRANLDFQHKLKGYLSTITIAASAFTGVAYLIVVIFSDFFCSLFEMDIIYIHLMFIYMLFQPATLSFNAMNHTLFKYKTATVVTFVSSFTAIVASIILPFIFENQLLGRVIGNNGILLAFGIVLFFYLVIVGHEFKLEYLKYAAKLALPLLPHMVSMYILGSSNKIIIQKLRGDEAVAFYNIGFTSAVVISMLSNSLNEAMSPWLFRALHEGDYKKVESVNRLYVLLFVYLTAGLILLSPEIMLIIGGETYREAQGVLMPIMAGCCCNFIYTLYVNAETFLKKPGTISLGTMMVAIINVVATFIFVKPYGYEAAAYTIMGSYFLLLIFHYFAVRKFKFSHIYDNKFNFLCALGICVFGIIIRLTFKTLLRPILIGIYAVITIILLINFRKDIISKIKTFIK